MSLPELATFKLINKLKKDYGLTKIEIQTLFKIAENPPEYVTNVKGFIVNQAKRFRSDKAQRVENKTLEDIDLISGADERYQPTPFTIEEE